MAFNTTSPLNAVAAANDYCGSGFWIGRTADGGRTWASQFKDPVTSTGDPCFGADPSVVYSARDAAFYLSTLCYSGTSPLSEVQVWKSVDGGATLTPSAKAAVAITNRRSDGSVDGSLFYDKELLAVDNNPASARYGRLYATFIKFHMLAPSGRSDYCPAQLAYTDAVPTADPSAATWLHTAIVADAPGAKGVGDSANQWAMPVVDDTGALDVSYVSEDCNGSLDRALYFKRSVDGGASFGSRVQINKAGQFADNPSQRDRLPNKNARIPLSPSMTFNPVTRTLEYVYQNNINAAVSGADISFQQSSDYGAHWSSAKFISVTGSGAPALNDQFFPWIAADDSGRLHVIWFDNRNDPENTLIETFQAYSADDGATWSNQDISSAAWNPNDSFFSCGCFIGDYNGLAASNLALYPVWTDGRNTPGPPNGDTDIFNNVEIGP